MATELQPEKITLGKSPIGLPDDVSTTLVPELDGHLSSLFVFFHQYHKHSWLVEGPQFRDLHQFIREAYTELLRAADLLAERIVALGGLPTSHPAEQSLLSYLNHEPEGASELRAMLELDRDYEGELAKNIRQSIKTADELGDPGTAHLLKEILMEVETRAHMLDNFIGSDSLMPGIPAKLDPDHR